MHGIIYMEKFNISEDKSNAAFKLAQRYASNYTNWRWGQCIYNAYQTMFPNEVAKINATENDCFYDDKKVTNFLNCFNVVSNELV